MTSFQRQLTSRVALLVMGLALILGGSKCLRVAASLDREAKQHPPRGSSEIDRDSGAGLPRIVGIALILFACVFLAPALLPAKTFFRLADASRQTEPSAGAEDVAQSLLDWWICG